MTRERIEDMREVVLPFVKKRLLETNYENLGESDAEMFAKDFDEILNLAIKALEQEPVIDKIRAEINKIYEREGNSVDCLNALNELKWFIDKCKAESENKE